MTGGNPNSFANKSLATTGITFKVSFKPSADAEAKPSVNGHCAIAALSSGCLLAIVIACPPPKELPQIPTRSPSSDG